MTTETEICNRALSAFGAQSIITDVATEDSTEAIQCRLWYDATRDEVLEGALWNFARRAAMLARVKALPGTPEGGTTTETEWQPEWPTPPWLYSYTYPTDCIKARFVLPGSGTVSVPGVAIFSAATGRYDGYLTNNPPIPFVVSNELNPTEIKVINTNQVDALLIYTRRVETPDLWSAQFTNALVNILAVKLSRSIPGDKELIKLCAQFAHESMAEAQASNGNEAVVTFDPMPDWLQARGLPDDNQWGVTP